MKYAVSYEIMAGDVGPIVSRTIYLDFKNPPNPDDLHAAMAGIEPRCHITSCEESDDDYMMYAYESFY